MKRQSDNLYTEKNITEHADDIDWYDASHYIDNFSVKFIRYFEDEWNWNVISNILRTDSNVFKHFKNRLNWETVYTYKNLTVEQLRECLPKTPIHWFLVSRNQRLSNEFILEYIDFLNIDQISISQNLSEDTLRKICHRFTENDWRNISSKQKLSEKFMRDFFDKFHKNTLCMKQEFSIKFLKDYSEKINWYYIGHNKHTTEAIIYKFIDNARWDAISASQPLSLNFVKKNWSHLKLYRNKMMSNSKVSAKVKSFIAGMYPQKDIGASSVQ